MAFTAIFLPQLWKLRNLIIDDGIQLNIAAIKKSVWRIGRDLQEEETRRTVADGQCMDSTGSGSRAASGGLLGIGLLEIRECSPFRLTQLSRM